MTIATTASRTQAGARPPLPDAPTPRGFLPPGVGTEGAPDLSHVLDIDLAAEARRIEGFIREAVSRRLRRKGVVLGVSGGVDSSVSVVLAARALGPSRVRALLMPERESSKESLELGRAACETAGVAHEVIDITPTLETLGCYARRDTVLRKVFPSFAPGDRFKIAIADDLAGSDRVSFFRVVAELSREGGKQVSARLPADAYLETVAATNLKQRVRKLEEYTLADRLNLAVRCTPNLLEHELGFFVRGGDGLADLKPIAHLYKTQVYAMARHLGLPRAITAQMPTTDTYSLPQSQQEFYFGLPYPLLDLLLWCSREGITPERAAPALGMRPDEVARIGRDIDSKRRAAERLDGDALLAGDARRRNHRNGEEGNQ